MKSNNKSLLINLKILLSLPTIKIDDAGSELYSVDIDNLHECIIGLYTLNKVIRNAEWIDPVIYIGLRSIVDRVYDTCANIVSDNYKNYKQIIQDQRQTCMLYERSDIYNDIDTSYIKSFIKTNEKLKRKFFKFLNFPDGKLDAILELIGDHDPSIMVTDAYTDVIDTIIDMIPSIIKDIEAIETKYNIKCICKIATYPIDRIINGGSKYE